jgi:DNA primase
MIRPETIQSILEASRIEEVINDFVNLKKRGVNFIGHCPFHNEKTPSFTVSPAKGIYKCFGCGKAGNSVNFLMEHEHITYPEALRFLAKKYHIEIEEDQPNPLEVEIKNERESLFLLNTFAQKHFSDNLFETEEGKAIGLSYLKEREFTTEIIRKFQLGYGTEKWDELSQAAIKSGYKQEYLVKTGLSIEKENGIYDRFRSRIIFPIHNLTGRVIGFTGRILTSDKTKPKYVNSPESDVYNKSKSLYGIFFARNAIVQQDQCLLVEGNADVISMFQSGIENVVASSGTSLTTEQVRLIKRYTTNITILYDGDPAGIKAAVRGTEMILEEGMNVRIVLFPDGEDPDSFARKHRSAEVLEFIRKNSVNFVAFKVKLLMEETRNDPIKTAGLIKDIVHTISLIPDAISRGLYIKECSSIMSVPEQTLINELNKLLRKKVAKKENAVKEEDIPDESIPDFGQPLIVDIFDSYAQEKYLIQLLLNYGKHDITVLEKDKEDQNVEVSYKAGKFIIDMIREDELTFNDPSFATIVNEYEHMLQQGTVPDEQHFIQFSDKEIAETAIDLISSPYTLSQNWMTRHRIDVPTHDDEDRKILTQDILESVLAIKSRRMEKMISELQQQIKEAQDAGNIDDAIILSKKFHEMKIKYNQINGKLGRVIPR